MTKILGMGGKGMKKFFAKFFGRLAKKFGEEEREEILLQEELTQEIFSPPTSPIPEVEKVPVSIKLKDPDKKSPKKQEKPRRKKPKEGDIVTIDPRDIRDVMELMEVPFVALSKNRTTPIIYESPDGKSKVRISCHLPYYMASVYDWDIIIFVSSKLQETINSASDIPPKTLIVSRNELIKAIYRHAGKTTDSEIEAALNRLRSTFIETTIHNEDYRYKGGFGFLDSWGYTERKDIKEFRITLSEWLYAITCTKGALLKVHPEYFKISSGLKRFLYRTARKHVGIQNESWIFSVETLYEKSGSEQEFKKFKYKLKIAITDNDIPGYLLDWIDKDGNTYVQFINMRKEIKKIFSSTVNKPNS